MSTIRFMFSDDEIREMLLSVNNLELSIANCCSIIIMESMNFDKVNMSRKYLYEVWCNTFDKILSVEMIDTDYVTKRKEFFERWYKIYGKDN